MTSITPLLGAGLAIKPEHFGEALACRRAGLWFETHVENHLVDGGPKLAWIQAVREHHPVSLHGVSLSLGGCDPLDAGHVLALSALIRRIEPVLVSEHLAWSRHGPTVFPDLLPFAYTTPSLCRLVQRVDEVQTMLGRCIAIENPSHYLHNPRSDWDEIAFLDELAQRTGCKLLLDLNNVFVSANNLGFDAQAWVDRFPAHRIAEVHLAGHSADPMIGASLLIDSHDSAVSPAVWQLLDRLLRRSGPCPCLIERDASLPAFEVLLSERDHAQSMLALVGECLAVEESAALVQQEFSCLLLGQDAHGVSADMVALSDQPGFAVYRNTVAKGCIDALQANFPSVVQLVGQEWFRSAAYEFFRVHPPQQASLVVYGEAFPEFLGGLESTATLPYLEEVAMIDQQWRASLIANDEPVLKAHQLEASSLVPLGQQVLRPHHAARWFVSGQYPVALIWARSRPDIEGIDRLCEASLADDASLWIPDGVLFTRPEAKVQAMRIDAAAGAFLSACAAGRTLDQASSAFFDVAPQGDLAAAFASLLVSGAFSTQGVSA
jgi:uncharacterized protein (UPF0276 family)